MNAVKQAIEALENVRHHISSASIYFANGEAEQGQKILGDAIRMVMETEAALAALRSMPAEPVAWGMPDPETGQVYDCISPQEHDFIAGGYTIPLYATPQTAPASVRPVARVNSEGFIVEVGDLLLSPGMELFATPHTAPVLTEAWISVDERLPKPWEDVLIYPRPTDYCCEGQVDHKGQWSYSEYEMNFGDVKHKIKPTHWMPLPPPPAAALVGDTGEAGHADQA